MRTQLVGAALAAISFSGFLAAHYWPDLVELVAKGAMLSVASRIK